MDWRAVIPGLTSVAAVWAMFAWIYRRDADFKALMKMPWSERRRANRLWRSEQPIADEGDRRLGEMAARVQWRLVGTLNLKVWGPLAVAVVVLPSGVSVLFEDTPPVRASFVGLLLAVFLLVTTAMSFRHKGQLIRTAELNDWDLDPKR